MPPVLLLPMVKALPMLSQAQVLWSIICLEEDLNPHGFHQWQKNMRISSMMAPTIVLKNNQPEIVLGSGGSNRIRTAILQVISNIVDFKMHVDVAVNSPVHWENNVFNIEPGFSQEAIKAILSSTHEVLWNKKNMFFGGVHTVLENSEGSKVRVTAKRTIQPPDDYVPLSLI